MSEVSLESAHGAYEKHRSSESVESLCESVVKGQAEYGYRITHIYSFIDINDEVQLFYCRNGNHEDLLSSPHVRKRVLLWESGRAHAAPRYLKRAYAYLLREMAASKAASEARRVGYLAENTGAAIRQRLEALGSDLQQPHGITFTLEVKYENKEPVESTLKERGFKCTGGGGSPGSGYTLCFEKELPVDEQATGAVADSVAEIAKAAGGELEYCSVKPVTARAVKTGGSRARRAWWKLW